MAKQTGIKQVTIDGQSYEVRVFAPQSRKCMERKEMEGFRALVPYYLRFRGDV